MKKDILTMTVASLAAFAITSCNQSQPQMDTKTGSGKGDVPSTIKIAYVEVDSICLLYTSPSPRD